MDLLSNNPPLIIPLPILNSIDKPDLLRLDTIYHLCYLSVYWKQPIDMKTTASEIEHISHICNLLYDASKKISILNHISWPLSIRNDFFLHKAQRMPKVSYPKFDGNESMALIVQSRNLLGDTAIDDWLRKKADTLETTIQMLSHTGTAEFFKYSATLYGTPTSYLLDEESTSLDLAKQFKIVMDSFSQVDLGAPPNASVLAETVVEEMKIAMTKLFGQAAPPVYLVNDLSANALAGANRVRIRKGACFTDKDLSQLIHHEAYVHVATSLNGLAQPILKILAISSPASTKTQEGLAVFAELITGSMDIDRMRRLSDRVIAIQMAIEGADFMEVFKFYTDQTHNPEQAFENTRRVFRGGVLTGGSPFTKDVVYLDGLLRVNNFLKALVANGRADCLRLLFCGKLDIEDIPMLGWLTSCGICNPAIYLPPWASDLRFLLSYLAYYSFLNTVDFKQIKSHYNTMLQDVPKVPQAPHSSGFI